MRWPAVCALAVVWWLASDLHAAPVHAEPPLEEHLRHLLDGNLDMDWPVWLQSSKHQRVVAAGAAATPTLLKALTDKSFVVRLKAAETLGEIRDPRAAPALLVVALAVAPSPVVAARMEQTLAGSPLPTFEQESRRWRFFWEAHGLAVQDAGFPEADSSAFWKSLEPEFAKLAALRARSSSVEPLPLEGSPDFELPEVIMAGGKKPGLDEVNLRKQCLIALGKMRLAFAYPWCVELFRHERDEVILKACAQAMVMISEPAAAEFLMNEIRGADRLRAGGAMAGLGMLNSPEITETLLEFVSDSNGPLYRPAVGALLLRPYHELEKPLVPMLDFRSIPEATTALSILHGVLERAPAPPEDVDVELVEAMLAILNHSDPERGNLWENTIFVMGQLGKFDELRDALLKVLKLPTNHDGFSGHPHILVVRRLRVWLQQKCIPPSYLDEDFLDVIEELPVDRAEFLKREVSALRGLL